jgi:Flp pilus assembly protein protease CpaA
MSTFQFFVMLFYVHLILAATYEIRDRYISSWLHVITAIGCLIVAVFNYKG